MWIVLVVSILNKAIDHGQVHSLRRKLREIPSDLNELFRTILTRDSQNLEAMKLCLQFVLFANRPLKPEELYYAILSGTEPDDLSIVGSSNNFSGELWGLFILSSSKGLAEITKSKHHIVQFIHESVRDFLLKENGLAQLWTDLSTNSVGLSHDRLKECCSNYMRSTIIGDLGITGDVPTASSPEAGVLRKNASLQFPFLEYAVHNMFAHADIAHAEGVSQEYFVKNFELSNWVQLNNIIERYEVRRLPSDIDLLYVLAERNYSNLIGILMQDGLYTSGQNGRFHNPIFAAVANNCRRAFEILTRADSQMYPDGIEFPYPVVDFGPFLTKYGKSALMHRLISVYNFDNTGPVKGGATLLSTAAQLGYTEVVQVLISKGANVNAQGGHYANALRAALQKGHETVVELLLDKVANGNAQGATCDYALYVASLKGHEKIVQQLLDKGANANGKRSALRAALEEGHEKVVQLLLDKVANGSAQGATCDYALYVASLKGHEKIVQQLLDKGADGKRSALQAALQKGHEKVVLLLLDKGANGNAQGALCDYALYVALLTGHEKIVQLLLDNGADVDAQGSHGTALHVASRHRDEKMVQLLLDNGVDVNAQAESHGSALQAALVFGGEKVVQLLLNHGADVNAQGEFCNNALYTASTRGYEKIVQLLLDKGADINAQGGQYGNALQAASTRGCEKIVQLLLDKGADINAQGGQYGNALQAASTRGLREDSAATAR